jgi:hypothetical protein
MMGYAERHNQAVNQLRDDLLRQQRRIEELERQLAETLNGQMPLSEPLDPDSILVSSIVSAETGEPFVVLRWFTHYAQVTAGQARSLAFNLLEAVEAARSDAFLVRFAVERGGMPSENSGRLLSDFREFREEERLKAADAERPAV